MKIKIIPLISILAFSSVLFAAGNNDFNNSQNLPPTGVLTINGQSSIKVLNPVSKEDKKAILSRLESRSESDSSKITDEKTEKISTVNNIKNDSSSETQTN